MFIKINIPAISSMIISQSTERYLHANMSHTAHAFSGYTNTRTRTASLTWSPRQQTISWQNGDLWRERQETQDVRNTKNWKDGKMQMGKSLYFDSGGL